MRRRMAMLLDERDVGFEEPYQIRRRAIRSAIQADQRNGDQNYQGAFKTWVDGVLLVQSYELPAGFTVPHILCDALGEEQFRVTIDESRTVTRQDNGQVLYPKSH